MIWIVARGGSNHRHADFQSTLQAVLSA